MGRKAPVAVGGVAPAVGAAGVGLVAGVDAELVGGTAGACALTVVQVIKPKQTAESRIR